MATIYQIPTLANRFTDGDFSPNSRFRDGKDKYNLAFNELGDVWFRFDELHNKEGIFNYICEAASRYPGLFAEMLSTVKNYLELIANTDRLSRVNLIREEIFRGKPPIYYLENGHSASSYALGIVVLFLFDPATDENLENPRYIERVLYDITQDDIIHSFNDLVLPKEEYEGNISISNPYQARLYMAFFCTRLASYLRDSMAPVIRQTVLKGTTTRVVGDVKKNLGNQLPTVFREVIRKLINEKRIEREG